MTVSTHETGATTSEQVEPVGGERRERGAERRHDQSPKRLEVFVVGAGQQVEEGIEAAVERAAELRDGAVEGVQRQAGGRCRRRA